MFIQTVPWCYSIINVNVAPGYAPAFFKLSSMSHFSITASSRSSCHSNSLNINIELFRSHARRRTRYYDCGGKLNKSWNRRSCLPETGVEFLPCFVAPIGVAHGQACPQNILAQYIYGKNSDIGHSKSTASIRDHNSFLRLLNEAVILYHESRVGVSPSPLQALVHITLDHYFLVLITFLLPESLHHQRRTIS